MMQSAKHLLIYWHIVRHPKTPTPKHQPQNTNPKTAHTQHAHTQHAHTQHAHTTPTCIEHKLFTSTLVDINYKSKRAQKSNIVNEKMEKCQTKLYAFGKCLFLGASFVFFFNFIFKQDKQKNIDLKMCLGVCVIVFEFGKQHCSKKKQAIL